MCPRISFVLFVIQPAGSHMVSHFKNQEAKSLFLLQGSERRKELSHLRHNLKVWSHLDRVPFSICTAAAWLKQYSGALSSLYTFPPAVFLSACN